MIAEESKLTGLGAFAGMPAAAPETSSPADNHLSFTEVIGQALELADKERGQNPPGGVAPEQTMGSHSRSALNSQPDAPANSDSIADPNQHFFLASESASGAFSVSAKNPLLENGFQYTAVAPGETDSLVQKTVSYSIPAETSNGSSDFPAAIFPAAMTAAGANAESEPPLQLDKSPAKSDKQPAPQLGIADASLMACMVMAFPNPPPLVIATQTEAAPLSDTAGASVVDNQGALSALAAPMANPNPAQGLPDNQSQVPAVGQASSSLSTTAGFGVPQADGVNPSPSKVSLPPNNTLKTNVSRDARQPANGVESVTPGVQVAPPVSLPEPPTVGIILPSPIDAATREQSVVNASVSTWEQASDSQRMGAQKVEQPLDSISPAHPVVSPSSQPSGMAVNSLLPAAETYVDADQIETEIFHYSAPAITNPLEQTGVRPFVTPDVTAKVTRMAGQAGSRTEPAIMAEVQKNLIAKIESNLAQKFAISTSQDAASVELSNSPAPLAASNKTDIQSSADVTTPALAKRVVPTKPAEIRYLSQIVNYPAWETVNSPAIPPSSGVQSKTVTPMPGAVAGPAQVSSVPSNPEVTAAPSVIRTPLVVANVAKPSEPTLQPLGSDPNAGSGRVQSSTTLVEQPLSSPMPNGETSVSAASPLPASAVQAPVPTPVSGVVPSPVPIPSIPSKPAEPMVLPLAHPPMATVEVPQPSQPTQPPTASVPNGGPRSLHSLVTSVEQPLTAPRPTSAVQLPVAPPVSAVIASPAQVSSLPNNPVAPVASPLVQPSMANANFAKRSPLTRQSTENNLKAFSAPVVSSREANFAGSSASSVLPDALPAPIVGTPLPTTLEPALNFVQEEKTAGQPSVAATAIDPINSGMVPPAIDQSQSVDKAVTSSLIDESNVNEPLKSGEPVGVKKGNQDADVSGMSNATPSSDMKPTEKLEKATERAEQNLPLDNSRSVVLDPKSGLVRRKHLVSDIGTQDCAPGRLAVDASTSATRFDAGAAQVTTAVKDAALSTSLVERTQQMVMEGVMRFKQMDADSLSLVFKPDSQTEMVLNLKLQGGGIEVRAELNSGNFSNLNQHWQELQDRLAQQGVKLSSLGCGHGINLSQGGGGSQPQFSQSRQEPSQNYQQPSPHLTPREPRPAVAALPHKRVKGWESWA